MWLGASGARSKAPAIVGIPPRSLFSSVDEGRAIAIACLAARGNIHPTPVVHGRRIVGFARGRSAFSDEVYFEKVPAQYNMAWSNYNDVIVSLSNSQRLSRVWHKTHTTAPSAFNWYDLWPVTGIPSPGALTGAANTANSYDNTSAGTIYMGAAVSPSVRCVTGAWSFWSINTGCVLYYDRVLDYQANAYTAGISTPMTNVATAARYAAAGQFGLQMTWATQTVHNATASNITVLTYDTPSAAGHTMPTTPTVSIIVSGAAATTTLGSRVIAPTTAGTVLTWGAFMPLASGDTGVKKVIDYTTSAANTGTFVLALVYPLAYVPISAGSMSYMDQVFQVPALERLYDGAAVCMMVFYQAASGLSLTGGIDAAYG